ncbi:hypothetical protein [Flavivirga jejuensis]|uniref:Uncharacterized protein n=1 Tax=Flavivirga jejuensis TaxID=870487 RepID=A0ABT8WUQ1_9FLAO|nr:hypothetical protein [Flavivirga jejuensis]MDO5976921.1 hypothetical protein [Flavivirga jejuensis]
MEVVVHGTKGGYKILYHTKEMPRSVARDVRRIDRNDGSSVGESAYSISFADYGCVFTKYLIIRDVERRAVGNVAFSVYIDSTNKLPGEAIKNLLDNLVGNYKNNYTSDGNLGIVQEDWTFVNTLINQYKKDLVREIYPEIQPQESGEAAYIYYNSDDELKKYFEAPYQVEYRPFWQVFFISMHLKNTLQDPLNALRHDPQKNITGHINLNNPSYIIKDFLVRDISGKTIELKTNGVKLTNNDTIREDDTISIKITKNYYKTIGVVGKINDTKIKQYLSADNGIVRVKKEIQLIAETKKIKLRVFEQMGQVVNDAILECKHYKDDVKKKVENDTLTFTGEELGQQWLISAEKGNMHERKQFTPSNLKGVLSIVLEEFKEVEFRVVDSDNGNMVYDFDLKINDKREQPHNNKVIFKGSEIKNTCEIIITNSDYEQYHTHYCPDTYPNPLIVRLKRIIKKDEIIDGHSKKYNINSGEHGELKDGEARYSHFIDGNDVRDSIQPKKGWLFDEFRLQDGTLVAQYSRKWYMKPLFMVVTIVITTFAVFFLLVFVDYEKSEEITNQEDIVELKDKLEKVIIYCNGNTLDKKYLSDFKDENCNRNVDTSKLKIKACKKIDSSLVLITFIESGDINKLKKFGYSSNQNEFGKTIRSIPDSITPTIRNYLRGLVIENILDLNDLVNNINKKIDQFNSNLEDGTSVVKIDKKIPENSKVDDDKKSEKIQIQQDEIKEKEFESKFWTLVEKDNNIPQMDDYVDLHQDYNISDKNRIKSFLNIIVKGNEEFLPFSRIPFRERHEMFERRDVNGLRKLYNEELTQTKNTIINENN